MTELGETGKIASLLKTRRARKDRDEPRNSCALFVGAGCSFEAGIPLAEEFIERIQNDYPDKWEDAGSPKDYAGCLNALRGDDRHRFIKKMVGSSSKLNPAHIAIAQLLKAGYADRILTTNFDPLIVRACSFVDIEPAVYDLPTLAHKEFQRNRIALPAIFYLHGQHTGVIHLNTDAEFAEYGAAVSSLIHATNDECTWIFVGYSGENDPTFEQFEKVERFEHRLYWVTYKENKPCPRVDGLLKARENTFLVSGFDADRFFVSLARELDCFPSDLLVTPFTHLSGLADRVQIPKDWEKAADGLGRETADQLARASARIRKIKTLVEGPAAELGGEPPLELPEEKAGLIANLSLFRASSTNAEATAGAYADADFRSRAFQTNWGPLLAAVEFHAAKLRHCWLVCTPQVRESGDFAHAASWIARLAPGVECHEVDVEDQNSIFLVQRAIAAVYDRLAPEFGLRPADIVADITGGLSSMTGGMVLATLDADRSIQYLRQGEPLVRSGAALSGDEIRQRRVLIGIRTSSTFVRSAVVREALA